MSKKIVFVSNVLLPIIIGIVTISLFFLFKNNQPEDLFWINLLYTLILEAIFFTYIGIKKNLSDYSVVLYTIFGFLSIIYILCGAFWIIVYSVFLSPSLSLKVYLAVILVYSAVWLIASVLLSRFDSSYKETVDDLQNKQVSIRYFTEKMNILCRKYETLCQNKGLVYQTDSNNKTVLSNLLNKISFITPNVLQNQSNIDTLNRIIKACEEHIKEAEASSDNYVIQKNMEAFVGDSISEIELIKSLSKK